ncbi:hybrid sensor histidine kinase/response regulator [Sideroxyarcus sp. TK5]
MASDQTSTPKTDADPLLTEGLLRASFAAMSEGMAIHRLVRDADGKVVDYLILDVNDSFERQTGLHKETVKGKRASAAYGAGTAPFLDVYARVAETQQPAKFEQYFPPLRKHFLINAFSPEKECFVTIFEDITNRKEAEKTLYESKEHFRRLAEDMPLFVVTFLPDGTLTFANSAIAKSVNIAPMKLVGMNFYDFLSEDDRHMVRARLNALTPECPIETHLQQYQGEDGATLYHQWTNRAFFDAHGKVTSFQAVGEDITQRKESEQALATLMNKLEQKEFAKSRFLAAASHDLRQPLAAANLFIDALKLSKPTAEQERVLQRLAQTMSSFNELLDALLNVSRLDAGMIKPVFAPISLADIFAWLEQSFEPLARDKGLGFRLFFPTAKPVMVRADFDLLKSVLMNLVSNAIKFTPAGTILIGARKRGGSMLFQVWDTGVGIPNDQLAHIFDEFYQVDNPQRDRTRGVGLGLAIAKRALALFDGAITCRSIPERGSVFEFSLPLTGASVVVSKHVEIVPTEIRSSDESFAHGKQFIVIEDEGMVAEALKGILENLGGKVRCFASAEEALIDPDAGRADYYIVDFMLAGKLNGIEFLNQLRPQLARPIRAVLMTGDTSSSFIRSAVDCDWPILHKPVHLSKLVSSLKAQAH